MVLREVAALWCDGGVIQVNPSPVGGTWAWVAVDSRGIRIKKDSGVVTPTHLNLPTVTNNATELLAAVKALQWVPEGWKGKLYTDSIITRNRFSFGQSFNGVPQWLRVQALELRRSRKVEVILVGGHPTRAELAAGFRQRNGLPVGKWNVVCDKLCGKAGEAFLLRQEKIRRIIEVRKERMGT